jgi:DNA recombination protein RmuC
MALVRSPVRGRPRAELQRELRERDARIAGLQGELGDARNEATRLETLLQHERSAAAEKLAVLDDAQKKLAGRLPALSADALQRNNQAFLELARNALGQQQELAKTDLQARTKEIDQLVKPLRESLDKVDGRSASWRRHGPRPSAR